MVGHVLMWMSAKVNLCFIFVVKYGVVILELKWYTDGLVAHFTVLSLPSLTHGFLIVNLNAPPSQYI